MLVHRILQGHVLLKCETPDFDLAHHVSVGSFRS